MIKETLVLNSYLSVLHVLGNVVVVYPNAVFNVVKLLPLGELACFAVLYEDTAGLVHRLCLKVDTRRLRRKVEDVNAQRNNRNNARNQADAKHREEKLAQRLKKPLGTAFGFNLG